MTEDKYQIVNNTAYSKSADPEVIKILEFARHNGFRVRICLGDIVTGRDWEEQYDVTGYVNRSFGGIYNVPILLNNKRSRGGEHILDLCIVKILYANKKDGGVLYQHPLYHLPNDDERQEIEAKQAEINKTANEDRLKRKETIVGLALSKYDGMHIRGAVVVKNENSKVILALRKREDSMEDASKGFNYDITTFTDKNIEKLIEQYVNYRHFGNYNLTIA